MDVKPAPTTHQQSFVIREATLEDDQQLRDLIAVPMTTRGVMISFQRQPSYFKASDVLYKTKRHVVIEDPKRHQLVACYSNGHRPCYINGVQQKLKYICDLRVDQQYRGRSLVKMVGQHLKQTQQTPHYSQLIIFEDNHAARAAVQTGKTGMPDYYHEGLIETLTLTGFKQQQQCADFLKRHQEKHNFNMDRMVSCQAEAKHIPQINAFIAEMAEYYNFLPAYDFAEILEKDHYFRALSLADFSLYFEQNKLIGMFGLWNQHAFKQTKIQNYGTAIRLLRPFYNLYALLTKGMPLPKKGTSFHYHVLHSLLCHPQNLALHHQMIHDAYHQSQQKGMGAISFTLSQQDPRYQLNQFYCGQALVGMHGFVSFVQNPLSDFDANRIAYLEVGRI